MEVSLRSTTKIVELIVDGKPVPARVWEGETAGGVRCHAFITRIGVRDDRDATEFERELLKQPDTKPSPEILAIPLAYIL
jgi:hypothetical protein